MIADYLGSFSEIISGCGIDKLGTKITDKAAISEMTAVVRKCHQDGGTVFLVGNGGSNAIISHVAIDLVNACKVRAMALTDASMLTCLANDYGYEKVFSQALDTMFRPTDVLIAVSSSGSSKNIVNAVNSARRIGGKVITYSGFKADNPLRQLGDFNFWLDSSNYGKVEIGHALLMHIFTDELCKSNS